MSDTYHLTMGDKGRLVIPAEVRERRGLEAGCRVVMFDYHDLADPEKVALELFTRDELLAVVQAEWSAPGYDAMEELFKRRRAEAARENAEADARVAADRGCSLEEAEAWLRSQDEVWDAKEAASSVQPGAEATETR